MKQKVFNIYLLYYLYSFAKKLIFIIEEAFFKVFEEIFEVLVSAVNQYIANSML
jgi:hypothetical protein